jgi:hypothetical protein
MARYVQPNFIVDSSAAFLRNANFDSSVYLRGTTHINAPEEVSATNPYALLIETGTGSDLEIKTKSLGTTAFIDYDQIDTSIIGYVDSYNAIQDASIQALESSSVKSWNGLTTSPDNSIGLGGILSQDVSIIGAGTGAQSISFGMDPSSSSFALDSFTANAINDINFKTWSGDTTISHSSDTYLKVGSRISGRTNSGFDFRGSGKYTLYSGTSLALGSAGVTDVSSLSGINLWTSGPMDVSAGSDLKIGTGSMQVYATGLTLNSNGFWSTVGDMTADVDQYVLTSGSQGLRISNGNLSPATGGIEYEGNYRNSFSEYSLIDRGFLDASFGQLESLIDAGGSYNAIQDASIDKNWQRWIDSNRSGFLNQTETTLNFNEGTGVFTLADAGSGWSYYRDGIKYTISGDRTVTLNGGIAPGVPTTYFITIDSTDGTLSASTSPWSLDTQQLLVAYVQWGGSNSPSYLIGEERHTMLIDRQVHKYLHETRGTQYVSGGDLDGPDVSAGDTSVVDSNNMLGISATEIADEDIFQSLASLTKPTSGTSNYTVFRRNSGLLNDWGQYATPLPDDGTYIEYDNGTTMVEATPGKFVNTYVLFTNLYSSTGNARYAIIPGQEEFDDLDSAIDENPASFDFSGMPAAEYVIAYQLTWEASVGYTTAGKVALASAPKRIRINATTASSVTTESHNDLIGLQGGNSTERYHLSLVQYNDYIGASEVDASITEVLAEVDSYNAIQDASIAALESASTDSWNGLTTSVDNSIGLGGDLFQDTEINIGSNLLSFNSGGFTPAIGIDGNTGDVSINASNTLYITSDSTDNSIIISTQDDNSNDFRITLSSGIFVRDDEGRGMRYEADYSSTFVARSLIDRGFLDSSFGQLLGLIDASSVYAGVGLTNNSGTFNVNVGANQVASGNEIEVNINTSGSDTLYIDSALVTNDSLIASGGASGGDNELSLYYNTSDELVYDVDDIATHPLIASGGAIGSLINEVSLYYNTSNELVYATEDIATDNLISAGGSNTGGNTYSLYYNGSNELVYDTEDITTDSLVAAGGNVISGTGITLKYNGSNQLVLDTDDLEILDRGASNGVTILADGSYGLGGTLLDDTDIDTNGNAFSITGALSIFGDLTVTGTTTSVNSVNLDVSDNIITVNSGESGSGVTKGYAGLAVDRGSGDPYMFVFEESTDTFRVGIGTEAGLPTGTQAVATREDSPNATSIPYWNDTAKRFDTDTDLTWTNSVGLNVGTGLSLSDLDSSTQVYALMAPTTDGGVVSTRQLNVIDVKTVSGVVGGHTILSNVTDETAYIKKLVAGSGATIISDASTITVSVSGAAGYVSKYAGNITTTAVSSATITAATHGLGTGPFHISVYDSNRDQVYVDTSFSATGTVSLEWAPGALTGDCSVFITG